MNPYKGYALYRDVSQIMRRIFCNQAVSYIMRFQIRWLL